ncbi:hypothetical protein B0H11DRAFT_2083860 [Mycena galericulata]|nr:hypothetical protein B0H11DRAFT_2083860 [Mycena galericulata]
MARSPTFMLVFFLLFKIHLVYSASLNATSAVISCACCQTFQKTSSLANKTVFSQSSEYQSQEASYYNSENIDLKPACRISPTSAADVSLIVKIATQSGCQFAVRSGGHMNWKGSSNIGPTGFTIDLEMMTEITLAANRSTISLGPGSTWGDVYSKLDPLNITAMGARTSGVGVGGFLLGGGISFLSLENGFASDNILNYEIVLASGEIVNANLNDNSDLYIALKYGSTNYGIITRFDVSAYELGQVWGGSLFFNVSDGLGLLGTLVNFSNELSVDPKGLSAVSFAWSSAAQEYIIWSANVYLLPIAFPSPLFTAISKFTPTSSTMRFTTQGSVTDEVQQLFGSGSRVRWFSLTLKIDPQIMFDIYTKGSEMFAPLQNKTGFSAAFTVQPISETMVAASNTRNGGNLFGQTTSEGNLLLLLAALFWTDPADDEIFNNTFETFTVWAQQEATSRGFMTPFIYMNYALGTQDVMASVGSQNEKKMRQIKSTYDPKDLFGKFWVGGYKL